MKKILLAIAGAVVLSVGGVGLMQIKAGASSDPPIVQEVKHQGEVLDNHEARITNTENNVKDLQNHTNTPPSTNTMPIPQVVTPPTQISSDPVQAQVVTVASFDVQTVNGTENLNCQLTYSDGTTHTFLWQTVNYNQGDKLISATGSCDSSVIGKIKADNFVGY